MHWITVALLTSIDIDLTEFIDSFYLVYLLIIQWIDMIIILY